MVILKGEIDEGTKDGGNSPNEYVVSLSKVLSHKSLVLDLGCGQGRNSVYLAEQGCTVSAVDHNEQGISKLVETSCEKGLKIDTFHGDMEYMLSKLDPRVFDAIISIDSLQFNPEKKVKSILEMMRLCPGYLLIQTFWTSDKKEKNYAAENGLYVFSPYELRNLLEGHNLLHYEEVISYMESHGSYPPHRHKQAVILTHGN